MKLSVFSILDVKSGVFSQPYFMQAKGAAVREFADLVADKSSRISKHPADYRLHVLGEYDDVSGALLPLPQPEFLFSGSDFTDSNKEA